MNFEKNKILDEIYNNNMEIQEEILEKSYSQDYCEIDSELEDNLSFYSSKNFKKIFSNKVFKDVFKESFQIEENIYFSGLNHYIHFNFKDLNNYKEFDRTIFNFVKKFEDFKLLAPLSFCIAVEFNNTDLTKILDFKITCILHSFGSNYDLNTYDIQNPEEILDRFSKYNLSKNYLIRKLNYMAFEGHPVIENNNIDLNKLIDDPENILYLIESYESLEEINSY